MTRLVAYALEALEALWRNRARSALTMLGMIIGTGSVIAVLGIGKAASSGISSSLNAFGDPGIFVTVDPKQDDPAAAQIQFRDTAGVAQATANVIDFVYPTYQRNYRMKANGVTYDGAVSSASERVADSLTLHAGRRIDAGDVANSAHVAVLSQPLARRFFGNAEALGEIVRVNGMRVRVVGVYDELKASIFNNVGGSDYVEIPYTVFHEMAPGPIDGLQVFPKKDVTLEETQSAVETALRHIHGPRAKYNTQDALAFINGFETSIGVISTGITAIGGVALLVAGIGVMNIMLVSVTERTREIGIRKAIGGSRNDIVMQFLLEAVILSLLGGTIGMLLGIVATLIAYAAVSSLLGPASIPFVQIVLIAVGFSSVVGIVFGTYPAVRAGRLDPIEALRS